MPIRIGDGTQIGPAVQIYAADHPREPKKRLAGLECGKSVMIGRNVWIGGSAILLPGIAPVAWCRVRSLPVRQSPAIPHAPCTAKIHLSCPN